MTRQNRIRTEREAAAASRAAEATAFGTAAASVILGATLPHQAGAREAGTHQNPDVSAPGIHDGGNVPAEPQYGERPAAPPAIVDQHGAHVSDTISEVARTDSEMGRTDEASLTAGDWTHASSGAASGGDVGPFHAANTDYSTPGFHSTVPGRGGAAHEGLSQPSVITDGATHALDAMTGTLWHIGDAIDGVLSSVTQTLTESLGNLSATISELTHSLGNPFGLLADNPVESILHDASFGPQDFAFILSSDAADMAPASPALAAISSLPGNILGVPDGGMEQTFGAPETLYHPSLDSFGELPLHVGFVGQALTPMADTHDLGTHGTGSLLHGFI